MQLSDRQAVVDQARRAEDLGFEELYSFDHLGTVDPWVPLVVAAGATQALRVGPLVINNELHHPALLARTVATVDRMSDGRAILGMGTGYAEAEHDATGIELRPPGPRVTRFGESLRALRALLDEGGVAMAGEHHQLEIRDLGVKPIQARVPFLIGGHGRRVVELAGRYADIFQFTGLVHGDGGQPAPAGFAVEEIRRRAAWLADAAGPRDAEIERSALVQRVVVGDRGRVDTAVDETAQRLSVDRSLVEQTPFLLYGSTTQIVERLLAQRDDLGISHVVVREVEEFAPVVAALAGK